MNPAKLVAAIMLVSLTLGAGLEVNRAHLAAILKNASLLARALLANFILVPIFGLLLARAFALDTDVATGFLLMAIAPGVPFVMLGARKKGGSLSLAVTMAALFPLISIVTVPVTASLVLPPEQGASLPVGQFVVTLVLFQLLPLVLGSVLAERAPGFAQKLERPLKLLFVLSLLVLLVALAPKLVHDVGVVYGSRAIWAAFCLVLLSLATGWLLGGPGARERRILSIGTALRNIGLCALVATVSFAGSSRVASTVLVYLLIQALLAGIVGAFFKQKAKEETPVVEAGT